MESPDRSLAWEGKSETAAASLQGRHYLFAIGIDDYEDENIQDLENAEEDARKLVAVLSQEYGYEVFKTLYSRDAGKKAIIQTFRELQRAVTSDDSLILYFAGHGWYDKTFEAGYLVPADAVHLDEGTYFSNEDFRKYIRGINSRHTLLLLDSCFSGSMIGSSRDFDATDRSEAAFSNLEALPSRTCIAAGRIETVSDGYSGRGGPFAESVITFLKNNVKGTFISSELGTHLKLAVPSNARQQPISAPLQDTGHQNGELIFRRVKTETKAWEIARRKDTVATYTLFVREYPQGQFVDTARARRAQLEDEAAWREAKRVNTISAYEAYTLRFARTGQFLGEAQRQIDALLAAETGTETPQPVPKTEHLKRENIGDQSPERQIVSVEKHWAKHPAVLGGASALVVALVVWRVIVASSGPAVPEKQPPAPVAEDTARHPSPAVVLDTTRHTPAPPPQTTRPVQVNPQPNLGLTDKKAWEAAITLNTVSSYDAYLERFPNGQYASAAKSRRTELDAQARLLIQKARVLANSGQTALAEQKRREASVLMGK